MHEVLLVVVFALLGTAAVGRVVWHRRRRRRLLRSPLPEAWEQIVRTHLPPYRHLPASLRERLHGAINLFLDEKRFEGCGGLVITDEIRVTIAAQACLLLVGRAAPCYPSLRSVLVYPDTYVAGGRRSLSGVDDPVSIRLGESWQGGGVVLSWHSVQGGVANFDDGQNVVLHEFAHQLDQADGCADGTPLLGSPARYRAWADLLGTEFAALRQRVEAHRKSVIDHYGATNPAEFFATASEAFFEKAPQLARKHPALYDELKAFYQVDPRLWKEP